MYHATSMQIFAFQGFRFSRKAGNAGRLAAPPFDQIDDGLRDELHAISPNQFSWFTRSLAKGGEDPYQTAAFTHAKWIEDGVVARDREPALYPYVIESESEGRQLALCCCIDVGSPERSVLRPHEQTVEKPLADRLALLRCTHIDPEPVMLLADDDGALDAILEEDLAGLEPLVSHLDKDGYRHSVFRISSPERIEHYKVALAGRSATIADGHHRCRTAQLFAREVGAREGTAAATKMAVLFSLGSRSLLINPVHRGVRVAVSSMALAGNAVKRRPFSHGGGENLAAEVAAGSQPSLGVWCRGSAPEVWELDAAAAPAGAPQLAADLSVVLLHYLLLPSAGVDLGAAIDGSILYRADPEDLFAMVDRGDVEAGFWLPPMDAEAFARAVSAGDLLPPKSTRFLPKLISGLVWSGHDAELL